MNKNTIIGLLAIFVIMFGFSWYNSSQTEKQIAAQRKAAAYQDSVQQAWLAANPDTTSRVAQIEAAQAVVAQPQDSSMLGLAKNGTEEFTTLENSLMKITFSNLGARVASVELKDYKRLYNGESDAPLKLFVPEGSKFGLEFYTPNKINTGEMYFRLERKSENAIAYRLYSDENSYVEYLYTIAPDDYMVDFSVNLDKFKNTIVTNQSDIAMNWSIISPQQERGFQNENKYTTVAYKYPGQTDVEELSASTEEKSEQLTTKIQWVAFKQQFFSSIIVAKDNFSGATVGYKTFAPTDSNIKDFGASFLLPYSAATTNYDFNFYFGPNKFTVLNDYEGMEFQKLVPLGWGIIGWVNRFVVIPTFDFLSGFITNFGIIILLLTIFIKIIVAPLTYKSYLSSAKMRLLKPELEVINKKFPKKEDAMKKQQAMMGLYKSAGVSPMGGCLPMLIQFPILIAMFQFFPSSIELRGESFLWAKDLSSYDSIWTFPGGFELPFYGDHISLFTLLMAISLFFTQKINMKNQPSMGEQMKGMNFMMLYMMPLMLLFVFNNSSSGLSYYYLLSNIITLGQTYAFRFAVSDEKLHARMKANASKVASTPQKKSKWAQRLEDMQKQAEAQQKARQNMKK